VGSGLPVKVFPPQAVKEKLPTAAADPAMKVLLGMPLFVVSLPERPEPDVSSRASLLG
jgi:hypothetical protein